MEAEGEERRWQLAGVTNGVPREYLCAVVAKEVQYLLIGDMQAHAQSSHDLHTRTRVISRVREHFCKF